jgi:hypothetical protein
MYAVHAEGIHIHTLTGYTVRIPENRGPGGEWVVYYQTTWPDREHSSAGVKCNDETFLFHTEQARASWWDTVRQLNTIMWTDMLDTTQVPEDQS